MRILVFSDSHGSGRAMQKAIDDHPEAEHIIFLGDGEEEFDELPLFYAGRNFYAVRGNCDWHSKKPTQLLISLGGKKIFASHGHVQNVKYGYEGLIAAAKSQGADIALFGHTHRAVEFYDDGLYVMNPGSISRPASGHSSYGIVDITPAGIMTSIAEL